MESGQPIPRLGVTEAHYLIPTMRYELKKQDKVSYTDYSTTDKNIPYNFLFVFSSMCSIKIGCYFPHYEDSNMLFTE